MGAATGATVPVRTHLAAAVDKDPLLNDFDDDDGQAQVLSAMFGDVAAPRSYREAMHSDRWSAAVRAEIDSLVSNGTFESVAATSVPQWKKLLSTRSTRWVGCSTRRWSLM